MKKYLIITSVLLLAAGCRGKSDVGTGGFTMQSPNYVVTAPGTTTPATSTPPVLEKPQGSPSKAFDGRLEIISPKANDAIGGTFTVTGFAQNFFEGTVPYSVFDANKKKLAGGSFIVEDNYGHAAPFATTIALTEKSATETGSLELYDYSAKDGSLLYKKVIPIKFSVSAVQSNK